MARSVGHNFKPSAALGTCHGSGDADSYMPETRLSSLRKRQREEEHPPSPPPAKKQKQPYHCIGYVDRPAFWNSLSKVWLTKAALRELDRRNSCLQASRRALIAQRTARGRHCATEYLRKSSTKRLKGIKAFARFGGPDLSDLVGYPEPVSLGCKMSSNRSRSRSYRRRGSSNSRTSTTERTTSGKSTTGRTKSSKTSNPYDANYQQKLIHGGVFPYGYRYPDGRRPPSPLNRDEINRRLRQPRPSLSPSVFPDEAYQKFMDAEAEAFNEETVKDTVLPVMLEAMNAPRGAEKNILFSNIDPITSEIGQAKPDYYYGARPEQIHPRIRHELSKRIIPSNHTHLPAVPNFFLEAKGPDGSGAVARRQACHNGAIGVRAMQSLHAYGPHETVFDNKAYTISSIYHEGQPKLYGHSVALPNGPGTEPEYYMHQLRAYAMTDSKDSFRDGAMAFRNAGDLTRENRNAAIARANEIAAKANQDGIGVEGECAGEYEEEGEEELSEEEEEDTVCDEAEPDSSKSMLSFDLGTNEGISTPVEYEHESETSVEDDPRRLPPAKRVLAKSHRSDRRKRQTANLGGGNAAIDGEQSNRWPWFKW